MFLNARLKISDFVKKNKMKIFVVIIIWVAIIVVNYALKNTQTINLPKTTYEPHTSIMDEESTVPTQLQEPIAKLIDEYFNYCNNKEYEKAYNMLNDECKKNMYPNIEGFKKYIDSIFNTKKIYNIQNYSNVDSTYIYRVRILDDILATGLTEQEDVIYYEEKFVIKYDNNKLKLSIGNYVQDAKLDYVYEDEYMKISVENLSNKYDTETYTIKVMNRSEHTILLADFKEKYEILLNIGKEKRDTKSNFLKPIVIYPNQTKTFDLEFTKFYDEKEKDAGIVFNKVRILNSYSGEEEKSQEELDNAVELYSFELELN